MKTRKYIPNDSQSNNTIQPSVNKLAIVSCLKSSSIKPKLTQISNKKVSNRVLFQKMSKQYVLLYEFSIMRAAVKVMKKNKWKKFYRYIRFTSLQKINWKILCSDIYISHQIQKFQNQRQRLDFRNIFFSFWIKLRKLKILADYNKYLMKKYFLLWNKNIDDKKKINKMVYRMANDCANCYFQNLVDKSAVQIQQWFRNIQFFKKLDNIFDIDNFSKDNQNTPNNRFGSFNILIESRTNINILPLFNFNQSKFSKDLYKDEIREFSKKIRNETSKELSLNDLLAFNDTNHQRICKNLLQYKFDSNESSFEVPKKIVSRSKKNEVINNQLKPIKMKVSCSFKKLLYVDSFVQSLTNFTILPDVKSPNNITIIERTEKTENPKEPKYIFYQRRYRSPFPNYDNPNKHFNSRLITQNKKTNKDNIIKQIFYSPKKINPDKIVQYNKEQNDKGINITVNTLEEYMISSLNIDIPLRFSDLFTEKSLNIHDFEVSYDPVMKQGIDDEIDIVFQNVIFIPHLSFGKFIRTNIDNSTYFLKYFRFIPYHLSKHQKRKLTEIIEPLLYSIMFGNLNTVLSADLINCPVKDSNLSRRNHPSNFSFYHRPNKIIRFNDQKYQTFKNNHSIRHTHRTHHHHNHYNFNNNHNQEINYSTEESQQSTESEVISDFISDIEINPSSSDISSFLNINENSLVFFCDESQISSDGNEFLINDYQPLEFKKKRTKSTI